jgi:hypothetical protein
MPFYACTICNPDGSSIAEGVRVAIEDASAGGWFGTITADALTGLTAGHEYRIVLGDGRSGVFRVKRNTVAGETDRAIAITGIGPLA